MLADKDSRFVARTLSAENAEAAKVVASALLDGEVGQTGAARDVGRGRIVARHV
jgi:hypothetical protein